MKMNDDATMLLSALSQGDARSIDRLLPLVYRELHAMADRYLHSERPDHTLQPTALVHEAYLRLVDQSRARFTDRAHFLAVASQAMRRILVDHARTHGRHKRGGDWDRVALSGAVEALATPRTDPDLVALDLALTRLAELDPIESRIVEMRFFACMEHEEIARVLAMSERTVRRRWDHARAWLSMELAEIAPAPHHPHDSPRATTPA